MLINLDHSLNVRNGRAARFWSDRWLNDSTILRDHAPHLPEGMEAMPVAEFVLNGKWNEAFLDAYLPRAIVLQVLLHPVPTESEPDVRYWRLTENGGFSFRTAYEITDGNASPATKQPIWRSIWRTPTLQRVRSFLWLLNHNRLLTNAERARRHLTTNVACKICGGGPETAIHIVRDCPFARATWAGILEDEPDVNFFEPELHRWSLHYLSGRSNVIDSTLFAGTCWLLWKNRNDYLFRSELKTHEQLQFTTKQLRSQITKAFEKESNVFGAGGLRERREIHWELPPSGWACVNTDGSATLNPASTSCGGVVRGDDGHLIRAFTANLGGGSITRAELAGIAYGLRLAWEEGIRKVVLQTDSRTARTLIDKATPQHPHYSCVAEIRQWLARPWLVRIEHVFREANFVADHLAFIGHSVPIGVHVIHNPSSTLLYWLYFDTLGIQTPRFVSS
ncbi:unnamed protein product [Linum trigynum]|uniref:RNase H type-1 domain-containing protein n=1 Tax=Linum trigynum TaxID=586398 RepID=A0AAV2DFI0_9ROSI